MDKVEFLASFPEIQSAIKAGSDGMRISLDIPESEMANAVHLIPMRGKILKVTIEVENDGHRTVSKINARKDR